MSFIAPIRRIRSYWLKETEKASFIEFHVVEPRPAFQEIDNEEEEWLDLLVNKRIEQLIIEDNSPSQDEI